jgi:hypothetical protein
MKYKGSLAAAIAAMPLLAASPSLAEPPVDLGAAGDYAILARTGISNAGATAVLGDVGLEPGISTAITGFGLVVDASLEFARSSLVTGKVFAANYVLPTPANLATATHDMQLAYVDAAGRAADVTGLGGGNIGGMTLAPGVYRWATGVTIPTDVTLSGGPTDVWIFQIAGTLAISANMEVNLIGGARADHVFWQVAGQTTLGASSRFAGIILDQGAIVTGAGARLNGRALTETSVALVSNVVVDSGSVSEMGSPLVDNLFFIQSSDDPDDNVCEIGVIGGTFELFGSVDGVGTDEEDVRIAYAAPQPTKASRSEKKVDVAQSKFATLDVLFDGASATGGPVIVEKCKVKGSVKATKLEGKVSVSCKLDSLLPRLSEDQITSLVAAFGGGSDVKVKVNSDASKGSVAIRCKGDATID